MRIFLSHGSSDRWIATAIKDRIVKAGCSCFLDADDILPRDNFLTEIIKEVGACDELLVLFTPSSAQRFWVTFEMSCFRFTGKPIIGVYSGMSNTEANVIPSVEALLPENTLLDINDLETYFRSLHPGSGSANGGKPGG